MFDENACLSRGESTRLWRSGIKADRELGYLIYGIALLG
jgi:hypothetical protein